MKNSDNKNNDKSIKEKDNDLKEIKNTIIEMNKLIEKISSDIVILTTKLTK